MDYVPPKLIKSTTISDSLVIMTIFDMAKVLLTFVHLSDPCLYTKLGMKTKIRFQNQSTTLNIFYLGIALLFIKAKSCTRTLSIVLEIPNNHSFLLGQSPQKIFFFLIGGIFWAHGNFQNLISPLPFGKFLGKKIPPAERGGGNYV